MARVELFFDCSSPGTYLAFHRLLQLNQRMPFDIEWRPVFIGGIFKAANPGVFETRANYPAVKAAYATKDFEDWERLTGLRIVWPQPYHPVNSIKAMRGCVAAARQGKIVEVARATFEAYWAKGLDISDDAVLEGICGVAGISREDYSQGIARHDVKEELRANGEELIARGGFGVPTLFVNGDDMYWGNDRMELVEAAIARSNAADAAR